MGVVIGVFAVYSGNFALLLTSAALIAGGAVGLAFKPKTSDPNAAKSSELQITSATMGTVIPVIFGTARVVGTFMQYKLSTFRSEEVKEKPAGSKEAVTTGNKYFLTWEQMLCMGRIDEVVSIITSPGERKMTGALLRIAVTRRIATVLLDFNQPVVGGTVTIRFSSTALLHIADSIRIPECGSYLINSIVDADRAVCQLFKDELSPWWPTALVRVARAKDKPVLPYPSPASVTRILSFSTTGNMRTNDEIRISGFGKATVGQIYNTHDADITFNTLAVGGGIEISEGTPVKVEAAVAGQFGSSDYIDILIGDANEGGTVRIYRGSKNQLRVAARDPYYADGYNYRQFCWAEFLDFCIGFSPQVRSYNFILRRFPEVLLDDGSDLVSQGFRVRGSDDSLHPCYQDANPAAIIWESFVNKIWGGKIASRWFDAASFITESRFFAKSGIGISIQLLQVEKISDFLEGVRKQCRTIFTWNGDKLKLRCLLDVRRTHSVIHTLSMAEIKDFDFQRPLWPSTFNSIKGEIADRKRNFRPNLVTDEDQANIQTVGKVNTQTISMTGFTDFETAATQLSRILHEMSFPLASFSFTIPRFKANMEVGDVVRVLNAEMADGTVTIFGLVTKKAPKGTEYEVVCMEDPDVPSVEGEDLTTDYPNRLPYGQRDPVNPDSRDPEVPDVGRIAPLLAFEFPACLTEGQRSIVAMIGRKPDPIVIGMNVYASQDFTNYSDMGKLTRFSIMGRLTSSIAAGEFANRGATGFRFSLTDPDNDEGTILGAGVIDSISDDLEQLDMLAVNYLVAGDEILQIGTIEKLGTNDYRATNYVRGVGGSRIHFHAVDDVFGFSTSAFSGVEMPQGRFVEQRRTAFRVYPVTTNSLVSVGDDIFPVHVDSTFQDPPFLNGKWLNLGVRPLRPDFYGVDAAAGEIRIRPRFFDRGAGLDSIDDLALVPVTDFGGVTFIFKFHKIDLSASDAFYTIDQSAYVSEITGGADAGLLVAGFTPWSPGDYEVSITATLGSEKAIEDLVLQV